MLELAERPVETKKKTKKPSELMMKAKQFRMLAKGYKALRKDRAKACEAAAAALERVEQRSG